MFYQPMAIPILCDGDRFRFTRKKAFIGIMIVLHVKQFRRGEEMFSRRARGMKTPVPDKNQKKSIEQKRGVPPWFHDPEMRRPARKDCNPPKPMPKESDILDDLRRENNRLRAEHQHLTEELEDMTAERDKWMNQSERFEARLLNFALELRKPLISDDLNEQNEIISDKMLMKYKGGE